MESLENYFFLFPLETADTILFCMGLYRKNVVWVLKSWKMSIWKVNFSL